MPAGRVRVEPDGKKRKGRQHQTAYGDEKFSTALRGAPKSKIFLKQGRVCRGFKHQSSAGSRIRTIAGMEREGKGTMRSPALMGDVPHNQEYRIRHECQAH